MGTRVIDMSSCPCCCDVPDYLELTIDYGGTCIGYLEEHQPGGIPIDCNEVLGSYYSSLGSITVQVPRTSRVGSDVFYSYEGQEGDLVQTVHWRCTCDDPIEISPYLVMHYTPPVSSYIPYTNGGTVTWPVGYCVKPDATTYAQIDITSSTHAYHLAPYILEETCFCKYLSQLPSMPSQCVSNIELDCVGMVPCGMARVNVSSEGVCLTESAWNESVPCMTWESTGMTATTDATCPDCVICAGGDWLAATLMAAVKVHVRAVRL